MRQEICKYAQEISIENLQIRLKQAVQKTQPPESALVSHLPCRWAPITKAPERWRLAPIAVAFKDKQRAPSR